MHTCILDRLQFFRGTFRPGQYPTAGRYDGEDRHPMMLSTDKSWGNTELKHRNLQSGIIGRDAGTGVKLIAQTKVPGTCRT